jgi:hypothetical protein
LLSEKQRTRSNKVICQKNPNSWTLCSKAAMQHITSQARMLGVDKDQPLTVYKRWKGSNEPKWIVHLSVD